MQLAIAAACCFAGFVGLGLLVSHHAPMAFDTWSDALAGHGNLAAWVLTWSCYFVFLAPLYAVLGLIAWRSAEWRAAIVFSLILLPLVWGLSDFAQHLFTRARPTHWLVKHETAFAYPSTHAALSTAFYGLWGWLFLRSGLPRIARWMCGAALFALVLGVWWARLALGAHHPTDIAGGALLGLACIFAGLAIYRRRFGPLRLLARGEETLWPVSEALRPRI